MRLDSWVNGGKTLFHRKPEQAKRFWITQEFPGETGNTANFKNEFLFTFLKLICHCHAVYKIAPNGV